MEHGSPPGNTNRGSDISLLKFKKRVFSRFLFPKLPDRDFLEVIYQELLGRQIDPDGLATYSRLLREGRSRWEVILFLIRSGEFTNHRKYDACLEARAPARKAFFVFSKKGDPEKTRRIIETICRTSSTGPESRTLFPAP